MKTILYIHGYGSTGNAYKAQELRKMFPTMHIVAPTFDYDTLSPQQIFDQLREMVETEKADLIVGSSTGGYYALCCSRFFPGPIWCVNPVSDILTVVKKLTASPQVNNTSDKQQLIQQQLENYEHFDSSVFQQLRPLKGQLNFALSTDDEVLGDHRPLLRLFPNHGTVVWKEQCGHRFFKFRELRLAIAETMGLRK